MSNTSTKGHGSVLSQLDAVHSITTGYYQPHTSVYCEYDVIRGDNDTDPVAFPPPPGSKVQMLNTAEFNTSILPGYAFVVPNITRPQILETPGRRSEVRLRWVELPQDPFNGTAIGAIALLPQQPSTNTTQEMLICNIGAGWGLSTVNTSTVGGGATTVHSEIDIGVLYASEGTVRNNSKYSENLSESEALASIQTGPFFELPAFPQRPIIITEGWASYLNPTLSDLNTTVFNSVVGSILPGNAQPQSMAAIAQIILAGMVANGLSRIGATSQLQGNARQVVEPDGSIGLDGNYWFAGKGNNVFQVDPAETKGWLKFRVSSTVEGYAYNTHEPTSKVAISILLAYCVVAVAHIFYAGISGISSTCWDSIAEVTALAVNTTPTRALRNTCAGITEMNIFKLPVRVLAMRDAEGDGEHLELVFGDVDEKTVESRTIKANRVYGTMPSVKPHTKIL